MRNHWIISRRIIFCVAFASLALACHKVDDATVANNVKAKIAAESPALANAITVESTQGAVTLTGAVDSDAVKARVEAAAKSADGVKSVTNHLTVKPPITFSADPALKNTVMANLTKYGITGVTVEVSNGEVTLRGNIARAKLQDAMKAANDAKPKKVNNQMTIQ
jgi:osmotically-inducible protein OsmY